MNKEDRGILIGMVLGDGSLVRNNRTSSPTESVCLKIKHGPKQREYIKHKANLLHSIVGGKPVNVGEYKSHPRSYKPDRVDLMIQKSNKYFRILRNWIYKNNKKTYSRQILNYLTPHGLALWWMDDGTLVVRKYATGGTKRRTGTLYTYTSELEANLIKDWFLEEYDITARVVKQDKSNDLSYCLQFNTENVKKLAVIIEPYIIPSMIYKIDMQYPLEKKPHNDLQRETARKLMYEIHERRQLKINKTRVHETPIIGAKI